MVLVMSTCVIQHVTFIAISFCTVDRNLVEVFTDLVQPELINIAKLAGKNAEEARQNVQSAQSAYGRKLHAELKLVKRFVDTFGTLEHIVVLIFTRKSNHFVRFTL